ncbi:MAG TPA: substrate-binding domain-containing protein, partial [Mycobacterium sp.]
RLDQLGLPTVYVGGHHRRADQPWVGVDDESAAQQAVGHLLRIGHRDIAMIQAGDDGATPWATNEARIRGFHRQIGEAGLAEPTVVTVEWGIEGGARGMELLLSRPQLPTAVFCHSDEIALGALRTLRRSGISVPQQVSVIGIDDHPSADLVDLTTVAQPVREQGRIAAGLVLSHLDPAGSRAAAAVTTLPTRLVIRGSTAPPR